MRTCPNPEKRRFPGQASARAAITRGGRRIRVYRCECGWWHHTTQAQPLKKRPRRRQ